jgi:hypothetical protein
MVVSTDGKELVTAFCLDVARMSPMERMDMVRRGIAPIWLGRLAGAMGIAEEHLTLYLGLDRRHVVARMGQGERLEPRDSEAIAATAKWIGDAHLLKRLPTEPGPVGTGVDIAAQLGTWLRTPAGELERRAPIQYLDVAEGRALVAHLWAQQHGDMSAAENMTQ